MHFSQKRELFLFPITTLLPSLIVRFLFVISLSACAARTVFCSFFVCHSFVSLFRYYTPSPWEKSPNRRVCDWGEDIFFVFSSSVRAVRTVICSFFLHLPVRLAPFFVRHLFVFCSSFVRLLFVFCSSFVRLLFICPCGSHRLLFVNCLSACRATTVRVTRTVFPISFSQINH